MLATVWNLQLGVSRLDSTNLPAYGRAFSLFRPETTQTLLWLARTLAIVPETTQSWFWLAIASQKHLRKHLQNYKRASHPWTVLLLFSTGTKEWIFAMPPSPARGEPILQKEDSCPYDIGLVLKNMISLSGQDKFRFLENVWKPTELFEFPESIDNGKSCK